MQCVCIYVRVCLCLIHARLCIWLCVRVFLCVCCFTRGHKSWITHRALICSKPVSSVQREEFFLALPPSLPFCLFVSRSVFLSLPLYLCLLPSLISLTLICLCQSPLHSLSLAPTPSLIYSLLFRLPRLIFNVHVSVNPAVSHWSLACVGPHSDWVPITECMQPASGGVVCSKNVFFFWNAAFGCHHWFLNLLLTVYGLHSALLLKTFDPWHIQDIFSTPLPTYWLSFNRFKSQFSPLSSFCQLSLWTEVCHHQLLHVSKCHCRVIGWSPVCINKYLNFVSNKCAIVHQVQNWRCTQKCNID